jgi:phosphoribosylformylglycinamidine (FGAM) synthase-like enzyme
VGAEIGLQSDLAAEFVLFGEDASRVVISCDPAQLPSIERIAVRYGIAADRVGQTVPHKLEFRVNGDAVVSAPLAELQDAWEYALERALHIETEARLAV